MIQANHCYVGPICANQYDDHLFDEHLVFLAFKKVLKMECCKERKL